MYNNICVIFVRRIFVILNKSMKNYKLKMYPNQVLKNTYIMLAAFATISNVIWSKKKKTVLALLLTINIKKSSQFFLQYFLCMLLLLLKDGQIKLKNFAFVYNSILSNQSLKNIIKIDLVFRFLNKNNWKKTLPKRSPGLHLEGSRLMPATFQNIFFYYKTI